jgi:hypothetical protein
MTIETIPEKYSHHEIPARDNCLNALIPEQTDKSAGLTEYRDRISSSFPVNLYHRNNSHGISCLHPTPSFQISMQNYFRQPGSSDAFPIKNYASPSG